MRELLRVESAALVQGSEFVELLRDVLPRARLVFDCFLSFDRSGRGGVNYVGLVAVRCIVGRRIPE